MYRVVSFEKGKVGLLFTYLARAAPHSEQLCVIVSPTSAISTFQFTVHAIFQVLALTK